MTMLNQAAVEALCSATYLENYLDTMESLPDDLQRCVTALRELDIQCRDILQDMDQYHDTYLSQDAEPIAKKKALMGIQRSLLRCQEIGDDKLNQMSNIIDIIENRQRQLDIDRENLDPSAHRPREFDREDYCIIRKDIKTDNDRAEKAGQKRQRRQKTNDVDDKDNNMGKKKKKRKVKKEREDSPIDPPIDPDEPRYCLCDQVSYGEMIGCDNDKCEIEWFHFNCVNLTHKPKGKWYCPRCRGDKPSVKKPDK